MSKIFAKSDPEWTTLQDHTEHVVLSSIKFAQHLKLDESIATNGAILHDLGKAHPYFQKRLKNQTRSRRIFRHEISSMFFLSAFPENQWNELIEMVVGHHKSVRRDVSGFGLLDLEENEDYIDFHLGKWEEWCEEVKPILDYFDIQGSIPTRSEALENLEYCVAYCEKTTRERGYSKWRGLLMGADHFASAQIKLTEQKLKRLLKKPDLSFYERQHPLYPLSLTDASSTKKHTLVVAPTGAGKTDYLLRRCRGRVFYTLPFQASINAMFKRIGNDLELTNPDLDIRVLHSSSSIVKRRKDDDTTLQGMMGAAVKILTPHQLATILFGQKGYESVLLDVKGCDVILDEVHTYSNVSQAMVIKLIQVLNNIGCRIHIGTATMPTVLYEKILEVLKEDALEVSLPNSTLNDFNRHIIHKIDSADLMWPLIEKAINQNKKVLIVINKVKTAQEVFLKVQELYPEVASLLLHSRFKRGDRNKKEMMLLGIDEDGHSLSQFNTSDEACIVVSTQVVEVSLDISFDIMFTQAAPLDALIQRFGRVNRKRTEKTIGVYKDIYVIAPPEKEKDARPYDLEIINRSYEVLEHEKLLKETKLQQKIDQVFTELNLMSIEEHSIFRNDGSVLIDKLTHSEESILMKLLQIDSVACITESDVDAYRSGYYKSRLMMEIPSYYYAVTKMEQLDVGSKPFVIPDVAYDSELGLDISKVKVENLNVLNQFI